MASKPFPAAYDGDCAECGCPIDEGDWICMQDGTAVHEDCAED